MRIVMMGPPGAGKGTQASVVCRRIGIPHISTGELFRANLRAGTALGEQVRRFIDAGEYVPDEVTNAVLRDRISADDCRPGFLLDGYPRTLDQVTELDAMLEAEGSRLDKVVEIDVDTEELVGRLLRRATEEGRADDTESVIRRRMVVYREETEPLTAVYERNGILARVDGSGSVDDVTARVLAALGVVDEPA